MKIGPVIVINRWLILAAAVLVQLCLGIIFAWSAFATPLTQAPYGFSRFETQVLFSAALASFSLSMAFGASRLQQAIGQRLTICIGGLILAAGYLLAGFAQNNFWLLLITIGFMAGIGIGLAYVHPIAVLIKWFPEKKGLITGLAVAGFALGATLWIMLTGGFKLGSWINLIPGWNGLYGQGWSVSHVWRLYGLIFALLIPIGSFFMIYPKARKTELPIEPFIPHPLSDFELSTPQMMRTLDYWILVCGYAAGTTAGLMVIGIIKLFGIDSLTASGMDTIRAAAIANTAMGFFYAISNAFGRIAWGITSDYIGRKPSIILMSALQAVMMLLLYPLAQCEWGLYIASALIGFNFGGNFTLFAAATADYFGPHNVTANYPRVFIGYGIGGIVGPILGGFMGDKRLWLMAFVPASVICFSSALLSTKLKPIIKQPDK